MGKVKSSLGLLLLYSSLHWIEHALYIEKNEILVSQQTYQFENRGHLFRWHAVFLAFFTPAVYNYGLPPLPLGLRAYMINGPIPSSILPFVADQKLYQRRFVV